ncbi:MAG: hypothetical protein H6632_10470 [Anaerolineales bacterium]|nr:hypothetical protein [Anaerolineales bacterium]
MLHLEELAREYQRETIRQAEQRRQLEEAWRDSPASPSGSSSPSRKLGHLLFVSGLKLIGWTEK